MHPIKIRIQSFFFPKEHWVLWTQLTPEEIKNRISRKLNEPKNFEFSFFDDPLKRPYEGKLNDNRFFINQIITRKNTLAPWIVGRITPEKNKTRIDLKMQSTTYTRVGSVLSFILLLFFCFLNFVIGEWKVLLGLVIISLLFTPLIIYFTRRERKNSLDFLIDLLEIHHWENLNIKYTT